MTGFQQIPQDMYPRPPKLTTFERPAWLEFCRIWVAYAEDCNDLGVKVARICKSFEGSIAVSVRSTLDMGHLDDLSSEWRAVAWDKVREKVDAHFKMTASKDDLRPVYSKALVLDSYDSFRSMHVSLTVFVSALAKKDAELGSDALPVKTKRDIVKQALTLSPLCKFWLENITFDSATEITSFLLNARSLNGNSVRLRDVRLIQFIRRGQKRDCTVFKRKWTWPYRRRWPSYPSPNRIR